MVQILKDSVRNQILEAAEAQFAQVGFKRATIGTIAQEAGIATGTVYTYFPNKKALFHSIITEDFVEELSNLTRNRIASFAQPAGLDMDHNPMKGESGRLLSFFVHNRLKIIILLGWGEGTKYESFISNYIQKMELQTMDQVRIQFPQLKITKTFRFMVHKYLVESIRGIIAILTEFNEEKAIYSAFAATTKCQLAGINALIEWALSTE